MNFINKGNSCETIFQAKSEDKADLPFCNEWYDGLLNSNYFNSLKGIITSLDKLMEEWGQKRANWDDVNKILKTPTYLAIIAKMRRIWMVPYYWGSIETSNIILEQLIDDGKLMDIVGVFANLELVLIFFFMYFSLVIQLQRIFLYWYSLLGILPIDLVKRNIVGVRYLEKIALGGDRLY